MGVLNEKRCNIGYKARYKSGSKMHFNIKNIKHELNLDSLNDIDITY